MRHSAPAIKGFSKTFRALRRDLPVLVLRGERSGVLTATAAGTMQATRPGIQVVTVSGAGHTPRLDEPEAVEALGAFLEGL